MTRKHYSGSLSTSKMAEMRWLPLESNPDVMNKYIGNLGVGEDWKFVDVYDISEEGLKTVSRPVLALLMLFPIEYVANLGLCTNTWQFNDVFGMDPDLLMMVPRPVAAVMLLFPITEKSESDPFGEQSKDQDVYFLKQTIGNACGTIGLLHALINNRDKLNYPADSYLARLYEKTKEMSPSERAAHLETDEEIGACHEDSAKEGQTAAPSVDEKTNFHFISFVECNGKLIELDGRKAAPVVHGPTSKDTVLEDACKVVKKFMERDPENVNFTMVALSKAA